MIRFYILILSVMPLTSTYPKQPYTLIKTFETIELRWYPSVMKIQSKGEFSPLFNYISGKNETGQKIEMTTPVHQSVATQDPFMEFVLPERYTKNNTPKASTAEVKIVESTPGYYVAIGFSGYATATKKKYFTEVLKLEAQQLGFEIIGTPILLVYNSPYRIFNRKNELVFEINELTIPK